MEQVTSVSITICGSISHYAANLVHNACVMSILVLIVGWIIGQGHYGIPTNLAAWEELHPVRNLADLAQARFIKGTALNGQHSQHYSFWLTCSCFVITFVHCVCFLAFPSYR